MRQSVQKRTPTKRAAPRWQRAFLSSLAITANVSKAAKDCEVARQTVYDHRDADEDFRAAWDDAIEIACDALELEARRRAEEGTIEDVYYQGEVVGKKRVYSDTLLIFTLKGYRPEKFRDRYEFTGKDGTPLMQPVADVIEKIYGNASKSD